MPAPVNVFTFGRALLETESDWSGKTAISTANPHSFTDILQDYTLPNVRLTPVRIGSARANYPIRGMIEDMVATMTVTGHSPALVGQVGATLEMVFDAEIEDDGRTGQGPGADPQRGIATLRGWCNAYDPGQVQGPYSQPQTATFEMQVVAFKFELPSLLAVRTPIDDLYDIDLDLEKYMRHGVSLWKALG